MEPLPHGSGGRWTAVETTLWRAQEAGRLSGLSVGRVPNFSH